ncbi:ATP-dependent endonuclease [Bullifex porci]|uniref:ATP-dependent nuclease n=1 Tax=Bullifex porci TaxID=2606638 RepID=UPI0023F05C94|nr:AAA family ATPase [Bullifex porci]MDD7256545.1 AAA family ATPase [Bullifex porci]MDY2740963.1 AAA family ATPase [Bullifex porci]
MKLSSLEIENFRAIKKCSIHFNELTALVGENNSGKTAILRALNSIFNYEFEECDFTSGAHQYAPRTITKIKVVFSDLPQKELYRELEGSDKKLHLKLTYNYSKSNGGKRLFIEIDGESRNLELEKLKLIKQDIDFVYIPANRNSKDIEWDENTIFYRLIMQYLKNYTKNSDRLSTKVSKAGETIIDRVLSKLARDLTKLNMYEDLGDYQFYFKDTIDYKVFLNKLGLEIKNIKENQALPVSEYGSGIKSLTVIALHRMLAQLMNTSVILGIEEPEKNLHPQAQRILINSLKKARQTCETQAVLATHSTVIVDELNHEDIVLVRKVKDEKRGFHSEAKQIHTTFWKDYDIQELKHYNFFRFRNSDFFFSKFVILTESTTDAQVIEKLLSQNKTDKMFYVSIVNLDGIQNIKYPFFLLHDLEIPFCAIVDKDFFTNYKNGSLDASRRENNCLPEYSGEVSNNKVIQFIFNTETKKQELRTFLGKSYSSFFNYAKKYGLLSMQYCLEMDLVANEKTRNKYLDTFNLKGEQRTNRVLLIDKKSIIKDPTRLIPVVESVPPKDHPISLKKIRNALNDIISHL